MRVPRPVFQVDELTSYDDFISIQTEWDGLLERSARYSPFLCHEWFRSCLADYRDGADILILVVRDHSTVIGIAPLWLERKTVRRIPARVVGFIRSPDTPLVDFIVEGDRRVEILESMVSYLVKDRRHIWDAITLSQWPVDSKNYNVFLEIMAMKGIRCLTGISSLTPCISIQEEWETFLQGRSSKFRKTHRNVINRINKLKKVEVQRVRQAVDGTLLDEILGISERSWKEKAGIAMSSLENARRFFSGLTKYAGERGWLLIWILRVDGVPIAMEYDIECQGEVYALRADYDETYREVSPGVYLEYQIIKYLFENGYVKYRFGPGMRMYKLHWTEVCLENAALCLYNNTLKGWLIWRFEGRVLPFLRSMRDLAGRIRSCSET